MELDDLKANWKNAGRHTKSPAELQLMTRVGKHPRLKKIRRKLLIEIVLLSAFLLVYRDIFDGAEKPLWANILLLAGTILFILNDIFGYLVLRNPVKGDNLADSVQNLKARLQRMLVLSIGSSLFFGTSVILFFSTGIEFTESVYLLLTGILSGLLLVTFLSYKNWSYRINQIQKAANEFKEKG